MDHKTNIRNKKKMIKGTKPKIMNIVATGRFPKGLDIVKLYSTLDLPIKEYEPETYPALLVKIEVNGKLKHVTLYRNGKYIIAGATSKAELGKVYKEMYKKLQKAKALD